MATTATTASTSASTASTARPVIDMGSTAAVVIKANTELSDADLIEVSNVASYGWAVETRYQGPTNTRGSRVKAGWAGRTASCQPKGIKAHGWDNGLRPIDNHLSAALAFLNGLDNGCTQYRLVAVFSAANGYVFTFI
jgi:hypothetical protein